jgi:hypothetical protein
MDPELIGMYHQAAEKNLPRGVGIVTSPMQIEALTLQRQNGTAFTSTQKAYESVYTAAGVNSELFNGARSSNESVLNSIKTDEMMVDRLNLIFCNFINYEIRNKKRNAVWKVEMLRNTYYNKKEMQASCRDDAVLGLGKLRYLSSLGYTPLTALSVLYYESESQMEMLFKPLASGYNAGANDTGRPSNAQDDSNPHNAGQAENAQQSR